jgi:hypothetical protein
VTSSVVGPTGPQAFFRFLRKAAWFAVPLVLFLIAFLYVTDFVIRRELGLPTDERLRFGFERVRRGSYDIVVLGNSRIYHGVNPDRLGRPGFNFAFEAETMNHFYYKAEFLRRAGVSYHVLVLGIDEYSFGRPPSPGHIWHRSVRGQSLYADYFAPAYVADFPVGERGLGLDVASILSPVDNEAFNFFMHMRFQRAASVALGLLAARPPRAARWTHGYIKDNGQRVEPRLAALIDDTFVVEKYPRLPVHERYFERLLQEAGRAGIDVIVVKPPLQPDVRYTSSREFEAWIEARTADARVPFLNYAANPYFVGRHFLDRVHLTEAGADEFSTMLGRDIAIALKNRAPAPVSR